jgi:hypothetical protein
MKHWTEDDFTNWLYGLKACTDHLKECPECGRRARELQARRQQVLDQPEVSWELLAAQRRRIYQRMGEPSRHWAPMRWVASVAMLLIVAVLSFHLWQPVQNTQTVQLATPADEQLFSDLATIEQSNEPKAFKPIQKLFQ